MLRLELACGDEDRAVEAARGAVELSDRALGRDTANVQLLRAAASAYRYLGVVLARTGDSAGGQEAMAVSVDMLTQAVAKDPENDQLQRSLGSTQYRLGLLLRSASQWAKARDAFRAAYAIDASRLAREPSNWSAVSDVVSVLDKIASCSAAMGDVPEATRVAGEAVALARMGLDAEPAAVERQRLVATTSMRLLGGLIDSGDMEAAEELYEVVKGDLGQWRVLSPDSVPLRQVQASLCIQYASLQLDRLDQEVHQAMDARDIELLLAEGEAILRAVLDAGAGGAAEQGGLTAIADMRKRVAGHLPSAAP